MGQIYRFVVEQSCIKMMSAQRQSFANWQSRRQRLSHDLIKLKCINDIDALLATQEATPAEVNDLVYTVSATLGEALLLAGEIRKTFNPFSFLDAFSGDEYNLSDYRALGTECSRFWRDCFGSEIANLLRVIAQTLETSTGLLSQSSEPHKINDQLLQLRTYLVSVLEGMNKFRFSDADYHTVANETRSANR